jgi:phenylacetate-CoA ligase
MDKKSRGVGSSAHDGGRLLLAVEVRFSHYQDVLTNDGALDHLEVQVEVTPKFGDTIGALEALQERLAKAIEHTTGLRIHLRLVQPSTIARSEGKTKRVIDQRTRT